MNILLIEPDIVLLETYKKAFELAGYIVATATDAQSAVLAADEHTPDAVVLELQLPAHNGIEFLQEFISYADWSHIPVVVNTYVAPADLEPARENLEEFYNVRAICYKPKTSLKKLLMVVRNTVEQGTK